MASRTKQKEEARARRLAEEQARAARERRERRLRMVGGTVVVAIVVVVVAIAISSGNSSGATGLQTGSKLGATKTQVSGLLTGIPQSGAVLGSPSAKVTLTYYGDLECPVCRAFTLGDSGGGWPQLVSSQVRTGKVKVLYRAFQTATRDASTFTTQQVAALAAGKQNHFWDYVEFFYHEQGAEGSGYVTGAYLTGLAQQVSGLSVSQWSSERQDPTLTAQVQADAAAAQTAGVNATPTLIAHGPKGNVPVQAATGIPTYSELLQAINAAA